MPEQMEAKIGLNEDDIRGANEISFAGLLKDMGDCDADPEAIAASEDGHIMLERMMVMQMGEDSDEARAYWAGYEKGLRKEVHGEGLDKWASYIPLAAETDSAKKFPLIFCLHGAHNPIQLTESYGVMQLAAREECIVIAPENENWDYIESLYNYAKAHFPVDLSRVYSIGYSYGGFMTSRNAMAHPEIFAGIGMGGMLFAGDCGTFDLDGQWYDAYTLTDEMLAHVNRTELPGVLIMGENEMLRLLPLWKEPEEDVRNGMIPLTSEAKQRSLNNLRRAGGCGPLVYLAEGENAREEEIRIGARFEHCETRECNGRKYFIGDSVKEDGEVLFRTIACEKMVHWPAAAYADLIWEHIKNFARDPKTGVLIRLRQK